jgi:hypothetical protein
MVAFAGTP